MKSYLMAAGALLLAGGYIISQPGMNLPVGGVERPRASETRVAPRPASVRRSSRKVSADRDRLGHYRFKARLNDKRFEVMVDTGASIVALPKRVARRMGIRLRREDYKHEVGTANGKVKVAAVMIDRIRIGGIEVRDVRAAVMPDHALDEILLGMSFLNKLKRFDVREGRMTLIAR